MNKNSELEKLKEKTGIDNFELTTNDQFKKIQELASRNEISKEQMRILVEAIPHFVQLQQTYVDGLKTIIHSAKESQKSALDGISRNLENITNILNNLINKSETEELRSKIADIALKLADYSLEIAKILHEANKDNNNTWKYIASGATACLAVVVAIGMIFSNKK